MERSLIYEPNALQVLPSVMEPGHDNVARQTALEEPRAYEAQVLSSGGTRPIVNICAVASLQSTRSAAAIRQALLRVGVAWKLVRATVR